MPRKYTPKKNKKKWTAENMTSALNKISLQKMPIAQAAREFGIPRATLLLKAKGWKNRPSTENVQKVGRKTVLGDEIEKNLVRVISALNKWGFGLSKSEILDLVQAYVLKNNIKTPFHNGRPGDDWWLRFKGSFNLSIRRPEITESARSRQAGDPFIVMDFFNKLEQILIELELLDKPQCIWNTDETPFCSDPRKTKTVSEKGKVAKRQTAGSGKENTTVLACGNAAGQIMPPGILFAGNITSFYYY